jgi:hypothetical protein
MGEVKLGTVSQRSVVAADSRALIVAALATVSGLSATPQVPEVPTEGAAWPVWIQATPTGSVAWPMRHTYDVYVLLPAGSIGTTVEAADGLLGQVLTALWLVCVVELAEPVMVRFDSQTNMPGLRLRVRMRGNQDG